MEGANREKQGEVKNGSSVRIVAAVKGYRWL